jgi:hypothetical protein
MPGPETGVSWRAREDVHRHEEANHEQGYGQEEGSEEEAGKVSAGEARREAGEETEPRVSGLRWWRPQALGQLWVRFGVRGRCPKFTSS